jgi:hypothetical protein
MKRALRLSYIYSAASVFIGPALVFFSSSRRSSGWDCSDPAWDGTNTSLAAREVIYDHNARFMVIGAYVMLVIGTGILAYLLYTAYKNKQYKMVILPVFMMIFMFVGYLAIITIASASSPWCGTNH